MFCKTGNQFRLAKAFLSEQEFLKVLFKLESFYKPSHENKKVEMP